MDILKTKERMAFMDKKNIPDDYLQRKIFAKI